MTGIEKYLHFCKRFHNYNFPKIKFKELSEDYKLIYRNIYNIDEDDINKASFFIFTTIFCILIFISFFFTSINVLYIISYSLILSLIISYRFNITLYKTINKDELTINALLDLIIINFSLIKKTFKNNSDYCIIFIELIKNYNLPISNSFNQILRKIHEGENPEKLLFEIVTPSEDFNRYLRDLLINNFNSDNEFNEHNENSSEKNFKVILRDIESKISIIFFIGLFFPISLCFLILFQQISTLFIIFFVPFFLVLLNFLFQKLIKIDILLIGLINDYSGIEKKKNEEFLMFLKSFASYLRSNISPERAFINAYVQNRTYFKILDDYLGSHISQLLNHSCSFGEMIKNLKLTLKSLRYRIILDTIERMLGDNAFYSSNKVLEIINIISKHRKLQEKLGVIIRGEKFKVLLFVVLLPIIIGTIGGMLPLLVMITTNIEGTNQLSYNSYFELINVIDLMIIFITLFMSNLITSYYFLKIINFEKRYLIIILSNIVFILAFLLSFINFLTFI